MPLIEGNRNSVASFFVFCEYMFILVPVIEITNQSNFFYSGGCLFGQLK